MLLNELAARSRQALRDHRAHNREKPADAEEIFPAKFLHAIERSHTHKAGLPIKTREVVKSTKRRVNPVHVVVIVEGIEEIDDLLAAGSTDFSESFRKVTDFGGADVPARSLQRLGNDVEVPDLREETRALLAGGSFFRFQRLDLLGAGFDRVGLGVPVRIGMAGLDHAEVIEEKANASGLSERAGLEQVANLRRGAIAVVREAFDDDRDFMRGEAFVSDEFVIHLFVIEPGTLLDRAFDGILVNGRLSSLLHG